MENDQEFFAAVPSDAVLLPQLCLGGPGDEPQRRVAGGMARPIVDRFEMVDVEQRDAQHLGIPCRPMTLLGGNFKDAAAVEQAGQLVGRSQQFQLAGARLHELLESSALVLGTPTRGGDEFGQLADRVVHQEHEHVRRIAR